MSADWPIGSRGRWNSSKVPARLLGEALGARQQMIGEEFDDRAFVLETIDRLLMRNDLPIDTREDLARIRARVLEFGHEDDPKHP